MTRIFGWGDGKTTGGTPVLPWGWAGIPQHGGMKSETNSNVRNPNDRNAEGPSCGLGARRGSCGCEANGRDARSPLGAMLGFRRSCVFVQCRMWEKESKRIAPRRCEGHEEESGGFNRECLRGLRDFVVHILEGWRPGFGGWLTTGRGVLLERSQRLFGGPGRLGMIPDLSFLVAFTLRHTLLEW